MRLSKMITASLVNVGDVEITLFSEDDYDDEGTADVSVEFTVQGKAVAQLLGKQERVLEKAMKSLTERQAFAAIEQRNNPVVKDLFSAIKNKVLSAVYRRAQEEGMRQPKVNWRDVEFNESREIWEAKIDAAKQTIKYTVELSFIFEWRG